MQTLLHETSPARALAILNSGVFLASQLPGDEGLNAVSYDSSGFPPTDIQAREKGAFLDMEWSGPEAKGPLDQYALDTLYEEEKHRFFIPSGSKYHLVLKNIWFRKNHGWAEAITKPTFPSLFSVTPCSLHEWAQSLAPDWLERQIALLNARVQNLEIQPLPLIVVPGNEIW